MIEENNEFKNNSNVFHYLDKPSSKLTNQNLKKEKSINNQVINSEKQFLNNYKKGVVSSDGKYKIYKYQIISIPTIPKKIDEIDVDNHTKDILKNPIIEIQKFMEEHFGIKFNHFNYPSILINNYSQIKIFIKLKLYQLLDFDLEQLNTDIENKKLINYFMTRTYEELYYYYINDINIFHLNNNIDTIIPDFPTISKIINNKKNELKKKGKEESYINIEIEKFKKISENIIEDINNGNLIKEEKVEKMIINVTVKKSIKKKWFK